MFGRPSQQLARVQELWLEFWVCTGLDAAPAADTHSVVSNIKNTGGYMHSTYCSVTQLPPLLNCLPLSVQQTS